MPVLVRFALDCIARFSRKKAVWIRNLYFDPWANLGENYIKHRQESLFNIIDNHVQMICKLISQSLTVVSKNSNLMLQSKRRGLICTFLDSQLNCSVGIDVLK